MSVQNTTILPHYGLPDESYQEKYCEIWKPQQDFPWMIHVTNAATNEPVERVLINTEFKNKLIKAFGNLYKAGVHTEIKTWDGCYNQRDVRGMNTTSLHAWAMAVDLNASIEKLAQQNTHWSGQFIAIMKAAGLFWGGDWTGRKDSMHFALYNG